MSLAISLLLAINLHSYLYRPTDWLYFPISSEIRSITSSPFAEYLTVDDGIYVINKFKNRLERTLTSVDGLSIPIKLAGYDPETGALWILTVSQLGPFRNQLIQFFPNTNIKHYIEIPFRTNSIAIADRYVYFDSANVKIFRLDKKTLSYAVSKKIPKGIYWYGEKSLNNLRDYTFLAPYFYYDDYLNRYEITCLYQDPPKLYVGTKGFGVLIYDLNSTRLVNHYQFGLKNISKKIWVTKEGIWFLTTGYPPALILYQPTLDKWQYYDSRIGYLASYQSELIGFHLLDLIRREELNNIVEDDNGFWLSTDQSLYFYQKSASDIERIVLPDGRRLTDINTLYVNKNELLIGTDNGLLSYDKKTKKFFQLKDPGQDLDWGVFDIVQGDDRLYIATYGSVITVKDSANKKVWDKITIAGLGRQTPFKHLAYANNYLFIGYDNGIIVYNQKTTAYEFITTQNGLLDNYIYDMMISCDHLWIIGPKGLARFQFTNIYKNND